MVRELGGDNMPGRRGRGRSQETKDMIEIMVEIAEQIQPCSVRALAYQLFNRKLITSMSDTKQTAKVSRLCVIAREEGSLPWEWIVDANRQESGVPTWDNPVAYAGFVQCFYTKNKWEGQPKHVGVWSEKGTVEGTLRPVLDRHEVPFQVFHGWSGATPIRVAAQEALWRGKPTVILYVGDYDPSGMGMSELDLPRRIARYASDDPSQDLTIEEAREVLESLQIEIRRIALTKEHTEMLGEATRFPASDKKDDPRYEWFVKNYGEWCWELDAMDPNDLRDCVEEAIRAELDLEAWDRYVHVEQAEKQMIIATCRSWTSSRGPDQG
jgi:hypothetical protein